MHLQKLILKNVRQFDEINFNFQTGFNLLVGENGAGKTTTLKGVLAALGNSRLLGKRFGLKDDDIRLNSRTAEITAIIHTQMDGVQEFKIRKTLLKPARKSAYPEKAPLVLLYSSNEAVCSAMKTKVSRRVRNTDIDPFRSGEAFLYDFENNRARSHGEETGRRFGDSSSVRRFVSKMLSTFSPEMDDFFWRFEPYGCSLILNETISGSSLFTPDIQKQVCAYALRWFEEKSAKRKGPVIWPDQAKVILNAEGVESQKTYRNLPRLQEIWEGMDIPSSVREQLISCSLEVRLTPRIMFERKIGTLSLHQLSDGEQRLFTLFVDIARQLSINNPFNSLGSGEAIILIDEIDVHLHPKWQRRVVPALEDLFPKCQFIATTHSPFVIQATSRSKIIAIDSIFSKFIDGGNSIEDIVESIQGVSIPQRSVRAEKLSGAAKNYFTLLNRQATETQQVDTTELREAELVYREACEPFTSNPSLHALLKILAIGGKDK